MSRLLRLALVCLLPLPSWGAITVIDALSDVLPNTVSGTVTINITSTSSGDEIVLCAVNQSNTFPAGAFTDSGSQTYTIIWNNITVINTTSWYCGYKENSAAGITSVTVTESSSSGHGAFWVYHFSGTATSGSLDTNTTGFSGPGAGSWTSGSLNTAQASEIALGAAQCYFNGTNCTMTAGAGWTNSVVITPGFYDGGNGGDAAMSAQIVAATQTGLTYTGTTPASTNSYAGIIAFKGSGGGGGATPTFSKRKKLLKLGEYVN